MAHEDVAALLSSMAPDDRTMFLEELPASATRQTALNDNDRKRAKQIAAMKDGVRLINCARGPIVDEKALVASLRQNHLAGAALDVFSKEPLPADHPLRSFPRVIITPHAAWYSPQALTDLPRRATQQVLDFLAGAAVPNLVNAAARAARTG
jgi:D-3-phosphoglycerate dehydrogenase